MPTAGAFLLSKGKVRLFCSADGTSEVRDKPVRVKYVSIRRRHLDLDLIKEHAERDRIFSYWDAKKQQEEEEKEGDLFLHGVPGAKIGGRTVPLFLTPPFLSE
eukprot:SAG31_NODE_30584_length_379_cov_0.678571_1_plen_102_part_01